MKILKIIGCWLLSALIVGGIPAFVCIGVFVSWTVAAMILAIVAFLAVTTVSAWFLYSILVKKES